MVARKKKRTAEIVEEEHERLRTTISKIAEALRKTREELAVAEAESVMATQEAFARGEALPEEGAAVRELRDKVASVELQLGALQQHEQPLREELLRLQIAEAEIEHDGAKAALQEHKEELQRAQQRYNEARAAEAGLYQQLNYLHDELREVERQTGAWVRTELDRFRGLVEEWEKSPQAGGEYVAIGQSGGSGFAGGPVQNPYAERLAELEELAAKQGVPIEEVG